MPMKNSSKQGGIVFVATGRSGLGHLRRVSTIARALRRIAPAVPVELVTNAQPQGLEAADLSVFQDIRICERADMANALAQGASALAVFDTIVVPNAERLPQKLALILRETPADRAARFALPGGRSWDALLIPNPADHWRPSVTEVPARRVFALGWIYRQSDTTETARGRPFEILVATGGGGTREIAEALYPRIDELIGAARRMTEQSFHVRQAIGPRARDFGALQSADEVFDPGGALNHCFPCADIVISTAGYNSVLELAVTDTPTMLIPIPRSLDDQASRARQWGAKLGFGYDPDERGGAITWLSDQIANPRRRRPVDLGPSGEDNAARQLLEILG